MQSHGLAWGWAGWGQTGAPQVNNLAFFFSGLVTFPIATSNSHPLWPLRGRKYGSICDAIPLRSEGGFFCGGRTSFLLIMLSKPQVEMRRVFFFYCPETAETGSRHLGLRQAAEEWVIAGESSASQGTLPGHYLWAARHGQLVFDSAKVSIVFATGVKCCFHNEYGPDYAEAQCGTGAN